MDPVSHGLLGASWAQSATRRVPLFAATALGCLAGMAPDLDLLIRSSDDPLLLLEYHRHFSHSLAFAPLGALLCAALSYAWARAHLTFQATYLCCLLGYATHGLLDACTSYGTLLLWPFSDVRVAWSIASVVDPAFTLPVLALVVLAVRRRQARFAQLAALWAIAYLALGALQQSRSLAVARAHAASLGRVPTRLEAKPALGTLLLWKTLYEHDGRYYVDAVRAGIGTTLLPGTNVAKLDVEAQLPWLEAASQQAEDLERFRRVSDDFLTLEGPNRVIDLRYSMVPNEVSAFWAIVLDPQAPADAHVGFVTTRDAAPTQALRLLGMLF